MEEIATVYARALFEAAQEHGRLDVVREQLGQFADAIDANRDLQVFFFSPYFSTQEKRDGLSATLSGADELLTNFLDLLIENHRMPVIFRMRRGLDRLWEHEHRLHRTHSRAHGHRRPGHPGRHRAARRQRDPRRLYSQPS